MSEELKPCQFCWGEGEPYDAPTATTPLVYHPVGDRVQSHCPLAGKVYVRATWNTRAAPSVQDLGAARDAAIEECALVAAKIIDPPAFSGRDKKSDVWRRTHALKKGAAIVAALRATPAEG